MLPCHIINGKYSAKKKPFSRKQSINYIIGGLVKKSQARVALDWDEAQRFYGNYACCYDSKQVYN